MRKHTVILVYTFVSALFILSMWMAMEQRPAPAPITGASSPVQYAGDQRPAVTGRVSETVGAIRMRRRHENDMDFSKWNPFYWQGRGASFKIEDFTSAGQNRLKVTLTTEWPQDYIPTRGPDFSAIYTGDPMAPDETTRSKFLYNIRMNHVRDSRVFEATLDEGHFNASGGRLARGQVIIMEFRFFMNESNPDWQAQKRADVHTLSAYYSEFIRIRVGESGLLIDHPFQPNGVASELRYSGGKTTTVTARLEPWKALEQWATNILPEHTQSFFWGRTWTHTDFSGGQHIGELSDDKPSVFFEGDRAYRAGYQGTTFNVRGGCISCHEGNASFLNPEGGDISRLVVRTADKREGATRPHQDFGSQLQVGGERPEGAVRIEYTSRRESLGNASVDLRSPRIFPPQSTDLGTSLRRPLPWIALGLIEALPDETIRSYAQNGGKVSTIEGRVGRFGHKAERSTIEEQVLTAMTTDLGVQTERYTHTDCSNGCREGKGKLFQPAIDDIVTYLSLLGTPPRLKPEDAAVQRGSLVFREIACASCHIPEAKTGPHRFPELSNQNVQLFSDFLLHDMGEGLQDDIPNANQRFWRTTPLIGMAAKRAATNPRQSEFPPGNITLLWQNAWRAVEGNRIEFLHDGRARSLEEAILWHGGEAKASADGYRQLSPERRADLHAFLWDI